MTNTVEYETRMARHLNELKWLYCELYHNDTQAFGYFLKMLRTAFPTCAGA